MNAFINTTWATIHNDSINTLINIYYINVLIINSMLTIKCYKGLHWRPVYHTAKVTLPFDITRVFEGHPAKFTYSILFAEKSKAVCINATPFVHNQHPSKQARFSIYDMRKICCLKSTISQSWSQYITMISPMLLTLGSRIFKIYHSQRNNENDDYVDIFAQYIAEIFSTCQRCRC